MWSEEGLQSVTCILLLTIYLQLANAAAELEAAKGELDEKDREVIELKAAMGDKDRAIKQLEIELLTASQKLATEAGDHAQQMQDQADEMNRCKVGPTTNTPVWQIMYMYFLVVVDWCVHDIVYVSV